MYQVTTEATAARCTVHVQLLWILSMQIRPNHEKSHLFWFDVSSQLLQCAEFSLLPPLCSPILFCSVCFIQISSWNLKYLQILLGRASFASTLESASLKTPTQNLILARLGCCNSILHGLPDCTLLSLTCSETMSWSVVPRLHLLFVLYTGFLYVSFPLQAPRVQSTSTSSAIPLIFHGYNMERCEIPILSPTKIRWKVCCSWYTSCTPLAFIHSCRTFYLDSLPPHIRDSPPETLHT